MLPPSRCPLSEAGSKENGHFEGYFTICDWRTVWWWYNCKINGVGRELRKTKDQVQKTASRESCLADATGSSISNELPQTLKRDSQISPSSELYSIWFISYAPEPVQLPTLEEYPKQSSFFFTPQWVCSKKELWYKAGVHSSPEGDHDSFFTTGRPLLALELTQKML